jgi:hypothetical protein
MPRGRRVSRAAVAVGVAVCGCRGASGAAVCGRRLDLADVRVKCVKTDEISGGGADLDREWCLRVRPGPALAVRHQLRRQRQPASRVRRTFGVSDELSGIGRTGSDPDSGLSGCWGCRTSGFVVMGARPAAVGGGTRRPGGTGRNCVRSLGVRAPTRSHAAADRERATSS